MSEATVRRVAAFDKEHRVIDGPRRVSPCTLPIPKFVWHAKDVKPRNAWSGPRGYDMTIREEAVVFKAAMRQQRLEEEKEEKKKNREQPVKKVKRSQVAPFTLKEAKPKREWAIKLPEIRTGFLRIMGNIFCMRVEVESYIAARKKVDIGTASA